MINIVTVSNSSYFTFLKCWSYSLIDKINLDNIANVYVIDTGLTEEQRLFVNRFPKFSVWDTDINSSFCTLHGKGWQDSNYSKLPNIKKILTNDALPTYFVDVDSIFVADFYSLLDFSKDIAVCNTSCRKLYCNSKLIGSFYGFNNVDKSLDFIDIWYNTIKTSNRIKTAWRESPSLSLVFEENNLNLTFQELKESNISHNMFSDTSEEKFIIHLKSEGGLGFKTQSERLKMPHAKGIIERYLNV